MQIVEETVLELFHHLAIAGVRYAVLRNYEDFPYFTHDVDLVMHSCDIPIWRRLVVDLARQLNWDAVTECNHWCRLPDRPQNIQIFRFYNFNPPAYLQVDLFHGYLVWGVPLLTESQLLEGRVSDHRGFFKIDLALENTFRLLQIHKLLALPEPPWDKIKRYIAKVANYAKEEPPRLRASIYCLLGKNALHSLEMLLDGKYSEFCMQINTMKRHLLFKEIITYPFETLAHIAARLQDQLYSWFLRPCGFIVPVFANQSRRALLFESLNALAEANLVYQWTAQGSEKSKGMLQQKRRILERGGLVIQWTKEQHNAIIDLSCFSSRQALMQSIIELIIKRHPCLYQSNRIKHSLT